MLWERIGLSWNFLLINLYSYPKIRVHDNGEETVEDEIERLRRENNEKDKIIADMREKMKEMQMRIQIPGYGDENQETKLKVPGLTVRV